MHIHSLKISNVRAVEHLELTEIPDTGVILIHGDNEAGKSTILDALDAVLYSKHTATGKVIRDLEPIGRDAGPEVEVCASVGPYTFTIAKRFKRKSMSELKITAPRAEQFTSREADDKLEAILAEHLDVALAKTLFLRQGDLDPGIEAAGIPSIAKALDQGAEPDPSNHSGGVAIEDSALMTAVEAEYQRYYNASGTKKGTFKSLEKAVEFATEKLSQNKADLARLADYVDEVARREVEIADVTRDLPAALEEQSQREEEVAAARAVAEKVKSARLVQERAQVDLDRADEDLASRHLVRERAAELAAEGEKLELLLGPAMEAADEEAAKFAGLTEARDAHKKQVATSREEVKLAERSRQRARRLRRVGELTDLIARLDGVDEELAQMLRALPETPVTDVDVRAVEDAWHECELQRRLREQAAAKLDITGPAHAHVAVDEKTLNFTGSDTVNVHDGVRLSLGEFTVVYRGAKGSTESSAAVEAAELQLDDLLGTLECDSLEDVRTTCDRHTELLASIETSRKRRAEILGGRDSEELRADLAKMTSEDTLMPEETGDGEVAGTDSSDVSEEDAENAVEQAQSTLDEANHELEQVEAALIPWAEQKNATALAVMLAKIESKQAEIASANRDIDAAEKTVSLAALEKTQLEATAALTAANEVVEELTKELAAVSPQVAEDLCEGARTRVVNLRARKVEAEKRVAELSGRIEQAAGAAERADRAEAELEGAEAACAKATRRAEAVKLVRETLIRHRDVARARYAEPFARALNRYASRIFGPDVEFTLGDSLQILARTVGGTTVGLDQLSGGAKEQLALLVRFAIAELAGTAQGGRSPVPVIVDDALGATDPHRLALMNSLFDQVGHESQVFVLTCFPQRFDRVSVAKSASISELKNPVV